MTKLFPRIGIFSKPVGEGIIDSLENLIQFLQERDAHTLLFETETARLLKKVPGEVIDSKTIGNSCDLAIVIGGDGSLLKAGRAIVDYQIPILGINRGSLGFLADIHPDQLTKCLNAILTGQYVEDPRCLLQTEVIRNNKSIFTSHALNDVVLHNGDIARIIEVEVFIDEHFVMRQRSDGIITATPTGSTAYALSAGGPILYPALNAIALVPMCPHTLTSRPIVVNDTSDICLVVSKTQTTEAKLSCDGQIHLTLSPGDKVQIKKYQFPLHLIHPNNYNYFALLREKLGWHTYAGSDRIYC